MATNAELVRFLLNDVRLVDVTGNVFSDEEIDGYLALEGDNVKLAAAQALDTIADNEVLASKVLKDHQVQTDGAKVADAIRKRADSLRKQAAAEDEGYFELIPGGGSGRVPELTEYPVPGF